MFCPKCGSDLPDDASFCGKCGAKIEPREPVGQGAAPAAVAVAPKAQLPVKAIIIAVAAIAVVAIAAAVVYFNFFAPYEIDEKTFSDPTVRAAIAKSVDRDNDGKVSRDEAKADVMLDLSGKEVTSLDGLQLITGLKGLDLSYSTGLYTVDASKVPALERLYITGSEVGSVDTAKLTHLTSLKATDSGLQSVDLSACSALSELELDDDTEVTGLDATKLRAQYLPKRIVDEGYPGFYDVNGIGSGMVEKTTYEISYDVSGKPTMATTTYDYTASSSMGSSTVTRTFNYDGDKLKSAVLESGSGSSYSETTFSPSYDSDGRLTSLTYRYDSSSSSGSTNTTEFKYDDAGKLTEASVWGSYTSTERFSYDDSDRVVRQTYTYSSNSTREQATVDSFDEAGRIAQLTDYNMYYRFNMEYDASGRCVQKDVYYLRDGKADKVEQNATSTYEYDASGRVTAAHRQGMGEYNSKDAWDATCEYDANGMLAKRTITYVGTGDYPTNDGIVTYEYARFFTPVDADDLQPLYVLEDPLATLQMRSQSSECLLPEQAPQVESIYAVRSYFTVGEFN